MLAPMGHDVAVGTVAGRSEKPIARLGWTAAVALTAVVATVVVLDHPLTERDPRLKHTSS